MRNAVGGILIVVVAVLALPALGADLGIRGSYRLVKRELPDGRELGAPDVQGFMTFTRKQRSLIVTWNNDEGKRVSVSYLAEYRIDLKEYCETPLSWFDDNFTRTGVTHRWPGEADGCSPVSTRNGHAGFKPPGEPVFLQFHKNGFTATVDGQFVDHWKEVR